MSEPAKPPEVEGTVLRHGDLVLVEKPQRLPGGAHRKMIVGVFRLISVEQLHNSEHPNRVGPVRLVLEHVPASGRGRG